MSKDATMPFGKHKGKLLKDVPSDYLLWVYENKDDLYGDLKAYIEDNLDVIKQEAAELNAQFKARKSR